MSVFFAITFAGLALGGVYFLAASGLSLIYGLMDVLNFAHGMLMTLGAYAAWVLATHLPASWNPTANLCLQGVAAIAGGATAALVVELFFIRPLYGKPLNQVLVTIGLDFAVVALLVGGFGNNALLLPAPAWLVSTVHVGGAYLPDADFVALGAGIAVLVALEGFLRRTRYGIIVRAGVEHREMVQALGINVGRAFTLVFVIGGAMAGLAGLLYTLVFSGQLLTAYQGDGVLIFAFIVVVIGGLGSIRGSAFAAVVVALLQDYTNYYLGSHSGFSQIGNLSTVLLLALVLQWRPRGLFAKVAV